MTQITINLDPTLVVTLSTTANAITFNVGPPTPPTPTPLICAAGGNIIGQVGKPVPFNGVVSGGTSPYVNSWSFGDGVISSGSLSPVHVYSQAGAYKATLVTRDSAGQKASSSLAASITPVTPPPSGNLLHQSNLQYLGAFRVPNATFPGGGGSDNLMYCGTALAFNPANNSLFMVGNNNDIAEVSIPAIVNDPNIANLNTGTLLQWCPSPLPKLPTNPSGCNEIGGLLVVGNQLVGTAFIGYDATSSQVGSHFVFSSLNLSSASVSGLYAVGTQLPGLVAGYMCTIPPEWQETLGGYQYLTGQADINIIGRSSSGPAAFGFNPNPASPWHDQPYVWYGIANPEGPYGGIVDPLQSGAASITGCVFVPGTDTVLFFGRTGKSLIGYGIGTNWGVPASSAKGPCSLNGAYATQVWAYNANDFLGVIAGTTQPYQVQPYDVWNPTFPNTAASWVGGVAFDPATNRIYVSILNADVLNQIFPFPLIQVYQVNPSAMVSQAPHIGTLSGMPQTAPSGTDTAFPIFFGTYYGPVKSGDPFVLTAGNVFAVSPFVVASVVFTFGALPINAKQRTAVNQSSIWDATIQTSGMQSGTYPITAVATDSNGNQSQPITWNLVIQ